MQIVPHFISEPANDIFQGAKNNPKTVAVALVIFASIAAAALTIGLIGVAPLWVMIPVATAIIGGLSLALIGHLWSSQKHGNA